MGIRSRTWFRRSKSDTMLVERGPNWDRLKEMCFMATITRDCGSTSTTATQCKYAAELFTPRLLCQLLAVNQTTRDRQP